MMPKSHPPKLLTIAGSDSGGGAGIQADLKTFSAFGCYGMSVITAITAQNTKGVTATQNIDLSVIASQINAVMTDIGADVIKTGMLATPDIVKTVKTSLSPYSNQCLVVDPVLVATSGASLGGTDVAQAILRDLFPLASIVTPNLYEAGIFLGREISKSSQLADAAADLLKLGAKAVLLKGGHLEGRQLIDLLLINENGITKVVEFKHEKISSLNTHGTGCTLASAIACGLSRKQSMEDAVGQAIDYVQAAIKAGANLKIGAGPGPLWHFYSEK